MASIWQDCHVINVDTNDELWLPASDHKTVDFDPGDASSTHRYLETKKTNETYIQIREIDRPLERTSPAEVHIKIHNPKPAQEYW